MGQKTDLEIFKIAMFAGFVIGALAVIIAQGSAKLIYFYFMGDCMILYLVSLLWKKQK